MAYPPGPWYRRYYGYADRPRAGCGCLYIVLILGLIYLLWWWVLPLVWVP